MEEKFVLTKSNIVRVLDEIRKPNGKEHTNDKTFAQIVPDVWNKLGLEGKPSQVLLERLLINLILTMYDAEKETLDIEKRIKAKQRDFSLLMFGLLDGYYHTEEKCGKQVNVRSEDRYERYLNDGYYISLDYSDEGTYQEIKEKDKKRNIKSKSAQPRPLNSLTKIAGSCKTEIAGKLLKLINSKDYKQYMRGTMPIDLPKPYYTLANFPSKNMNPESDSTNNPARESGIEQEDAPTRDNHEADEANGSVTDDDKAATELGDDPHGEGAGTSIVEPSENDDGLPDKKKYPKWIIVGIGAIIILFIIIVCRSLNLNMGFSVNTQFQTEKPSAIGQNQYQEEDPFSPQRFEFNFGININFSVSSGVDSEKNGEPVINDVPIPEPAEAGSE